MQIRKMYLSRVMMDTKHNINKNARMPKLTFELCIGNFIIQTGFSLSFIFSTLSFVIFYNYSVIIDN